MFIDKVRITIKAGDGGDGHVSFGFNRKPDGGIGGNGGDVYLQGDANIADLNSFQKRDESYIAGKAERGGANNCTGKNGDDLVIRVPLITSVIADDGEMLMQITRDGEKLLLLRGGRGGLGNQYFRKGQVATLRKFTSGKKGEVFNGFFELQLQTDVVFIGLPNAGKSSMLNALSNASVKVGNYPFTTLTPHLARAGRLTLLDLPGLIEGTTEGKGLGTRFMKHAKSARLVAHFLSLESDDLQRDYDVIRKELKLIDPELITKPELIILTKKDLSTDAEIKKRIKELKTKSRIETASVYDYDGLRELLEVMKEMCK